MVAIFLGFHCGCQCVLALGHSNWHLDKHAAVLSLHVLGVDPTGDFASVVPEKGIRSALQADWTFGVDVSATIIFNKLLQFIELFQCFDVSALNMTRVIIVILSTYLVLKLYSL